MERLRIKAVFKEAILAVVALVLAIGPAMFLYEKMEAQQALPLGAYGNIPALTGNVGATITGTVPSTQMAGLLNQTPGAAITDTTDTATNLCALFPVVQNQGAFSWDLWSKNIGAGGIITWAGGAGVTLVGTGTIATNSVRHFKVTVNGCGTGTPTPTPTAQLISLETSAF